MILFSSHRVYVYSLSLKLCCSYKLGKKEILSEIWTSDAFKLDLYHFFHSRHHFIELNKYAWEVNRMVKQIELNTSLPLVQVLLMCVAETLCREKQRDQELLENKSSCICTLNYRKRRINF